MASLEDRNAENSVVRYNTTNDPEAVHVDLQSPAKNRYKGTPLSPKRRNPLILFERASGKWWNPTFDSKALEEQLWRSYFPQTRRRFQYALIYIVIACIAWLIFFGLTKEPNWMYFMGGTGCLLAVTVLLIGFTKTPFYERFYLVTSVVYVLFLAALILCPFAFKSHSDLSTIGSFSGSVEILLMIYTIIPLPLFVAVAIGITYSILYEILVALLAEGMEEAVFIVGKILLHLCIHLMGVHIFIMSQVARRSTFWKIGQSVIARRDLQVEKQLKEKMIHSLMPPSVAQAVMKFRDEPRDDAEGDSDQPRSKKGRRSKKDGKEKGMIRFRPFNMNQLDNVSILFADIVGFTKMSSNKTAEHLVSLLNDLFGRFDKLCSSSGCEKISTLGDCYYCVAGCPEPRPDHAKCCAEMGLGMIKLIKEFDEDNNEEVNMRVGVHTGTVLCGIVGTRRFKFDVWSNDVTLANIMESTGRPGTVHISETTYSFLKDVYEVEEGDVVDDLNTNKTLIEHYDITKSSFTIRHTEDLNVIKTYFILGPKKVEATSPEGERSQSPNSTVVPIDDSATDADKTKPTADPSSGGENSATATSNHLEREMSETNGVTPAALLGRRHSSGFFASTTSVDRIPEEGKSGCSHLFCCVESRTSNLDHVTKNHRPPPQSQLNNNISRASKPSPQTASVKPNNLGPVKDLHDMPIARALSLDLLMNVEDPSTTPINEQWTKVRRIRDQNDKQIIKCLQEDVTNKEFFYQPPINKFTLSFNQPVLEEDYRDHYLESTLYKEETTASPRYHALLEIIVSCLFFTIISICCFMVFYRQTVWIIVFCIAVILEVLILVQVMLSQKAEQYEAVIQFMSGWYFRNFLGAVVASLPAVAVYTNLSCQVITNHTYRDYFFCFGVVASLLHFCNFTMLSSWLKSILAAFCGIALLVLLNLEICPFLSKPDPSMSYNTTTSTNSSFDVLIPFPTLNDTKSLFTGESPVRYEIILDMILLLLLILFMNREFEISYRLSYYGSAEADRDKRQMQENKDQADWLLHNIIPKHISEIVKKTSKYSKNHKDCGVIFATIVNFNEFYDESYEGGREYLRVLNELVSDYEVLLDQAEYKDVEKIKTISSTFMAASGLNEQSRAQNKDPRAHLYALLCFAMELQNVVQRFNESIFNFEFILNIGYNYGEVTAGVIGTTKLLYDIWGDTVNIASRMYSTGVANKIQVPEATSKYLAEMFEFEYRDEITVKGKGQMKTYLVVKKKEGAKWE